MMFTVLDHLLNGAFLVFTIAVITVAIDMARYVFGGEDES